MMASVLVAVISVLLIVGVLVLVRLASRVGPSWLRPAHAPLWLVAGLVVTGCAVIADRLRPDLAELIAARLHLAARGPSARMAQLALLLAALLVVFVIVRVLFVALRRRRLDRAPIPAWFLLLGIGRDGQPLRSLRQRLFVATLLVTIGLALASLLLPFEADSLPWAALVTLVTSGTLALAPARRTISIVDEYDTIAPPARSAFVHQQQLDEALRRALEGDEVVWITPAPEVARAAFAGTSEAVLLPPLRALPLAELTSVVGRVDLIVVEGTQVMTGVELAFLDEQLARLPHAELLRTPGAAERARPLQVRSVVGALPAARVSNGTPIRTTRVRLTGLPQRTRHRFRGALELELVAARAELTVTDDGLREHGPDQRRAHTRSAGTEVRPPMVVDARIAIVPSADPVTLHTLVHVLRELAPTLFRGAQDLLGVTYATAAELAGPHGGVVVHDRAPDAPSSVADLNERDWLAWLIAARARLAACDCASHCSRCCETVSCTATPHNVTLDRRRALALLDGLLVSPIERQVA